MLRKSDVRAKGRGGGARARCEAPGARGGRSAALRGAAAPPALHLSQPAAPSPGLRTRPCAPVRHPQTFAEGGRGGRGKEANESGRGSRRGERSEARGGGGGGGGSSIMSAGGDFGNPLRKFKLVFLGEQSGESPGLPHTGVAGRAPPSPPQTPPDPPLWGGGRA